MAGFEHGRLGNASGRLMQMTGFKELNDVLKQLPKELAQQAVRGALRKAAVPILEEARRLAPFGHEAKGRVRVRRTKGGKVRIANYGKLRGELKIISLPNKNAQAGTSVAISVGKAYWGMFLEFGTRHMSKRPFLRPALEMKAEQALAVLRNELAANIVKIAERLARR